MLAYLLTAIYFGLLLVPDYPPASSPWFWKAMIPVVVIHLVILSGVVWLDFKVPYINTLPRALLGFAGIIVFAEWRLARRIIDAFEPNRSTIPTPVRRR